MARWRASDTQADPRRATRPGGRGEPYEVTSSRHDRPCRAKPTGTYVADSFTGDVTATMGGTFALAHDGEPAGLARVTLAMRTPVRKESPAPRRLVGLCAWAAVLGILGAILAIRAAVGVMIGTPAWFLPTAAIDRHGRRRRRPWARSSPHARAPCRGCCSAWPPCALLGAFVTSLVGI